MTRAGRICFQRCSIARLSSNCKVYQVQNPLKACGGMVEQLRTASPVE
jgi:hypothetical protein